MIALLLACSTSVPSIPDAPNTASMANPLLSIERFAERHVEKAIVAEVLDAGGYQYLRLADDRWLATLDGGHAQGDAVSVVGIGEATDFHSDRLDRDFDALMFAVVRQR